MRWLPTLSMMLVSMISYIDRNTLALLAPTILKDTGLTNEQYGWIISAFSVAYMIGNPVWGRILDRVGVRRGMTGAVSLWTLASTAHVAATGFWSFAAFRALLGFGEGATFPGGLRTVVQTLPAELRSRGTALAYSGGSLGALITPLIVTPVAAAWGWRGAFWATGAVGTLWVLWWTVLGRRESLATTEPAHSSGLSMAWNDANVWALVAAYSLGGLPIGFVLYQASLYLSAVLHQTQTDIGKVLWVPPLGWEVGYFFWGWVIDRFASAGRDRRAMLRVFLIGALLSLPLAAAPLFQTLLPTLGFMFFAMFIAASFVIGSVAYATGVYSTRYSGLISGIGAGSWSAWVALVMPWIGRLFDLHDYGAAFVLAGAAPVVGFALWVPLSRKS